MSKARSLDQKVSLLVKLHVALRQAYGASKKEVTQEKSELYSRLDSSHL